MEICLHVGAHRTGTTGFQTMLDANRGRLDLARIAVKGPRRTRSGLFAGLVRNPDHLNAFEDAAGQRSIGRIKMEMARLGQAGTKTLVFSEENMIGTMIENIASGSLYGQAERRMQRFAPAFEHTRPRIWLSIRSYDMHWASQLAFRIKAGEQVPEQWGIDALAAQPRGWADVIVSLKRALPEAHVFVARFEDWAGRPSAMLDAYLGQHLRLPDTATRPSNASDDAQALAALAEHRGDSAGALRLATYTQSGRYMPFNADQQAQMQQNYREDLAWLKAGAEGCATYLDPTEGTFGGRDMTEGSLHDRQEASVASPR